MPTENRPLYKRAKFMGPFWCSVCCVGVFVYAMLIIPGTAGEQLKSLTTIITSTITALITLGVIIGGGAAVHDATRDFGKGRQNL